ncbi:MAG: T9SS type A sorting domain-containing protein [Flammeovirgaceae bacterium]|nr:T9SS type A sorting domain-containing protein [Flammeovirgaceae bacterium]
MADGNQWYLNGMVIVGAKGQTYTVLTSGIYQVSATLGSCTSELSLAKVFLITGNEIKVSTINIRVYPNPVESMLTIGLGGFAPDYKVEIAVTDMNGREIMNLNSMGEEEIQVNVSYFSTGLYLIWMTQHDKVRTLRFVKK